MTRRIDVLFIDILSLFQVVKAQRHHKDGANGTNSFLMGVWVNFKRVVRHYRGYRRHHNIALGHNPVVTARDI